MTDDATQSHLTGAPHNHLDLEPWVVFIGQTPHSSIALWQIDQQSALSLAIFSDRAKASGYAGQHCAAPYQIQQLDQPKLIRVMAECYRHGLRYATLNPTDHSARQIFVLQDVLKSARSWLQQLQKDTL